MDRDELDAFFAQAEDVLTDWRPGIDAMHGAAPAGHEVDEPAPVGSSYYEQRWQAQQVSPGMAAAAAAARAFAEGLLRLTEISRQIGTVLSELAKRLRAQSRPKVCAPLGHAFRPDFDLVCTVPRCGLGPEEH